MQEKEEIHKKLLEIILKVTGINIDKMDISLFSTEYNVSVVEMANILLLIQKELKVNLNTEFIDSCQEFTITKVADSIYGYNFY